MTEQGYRPPEEVIFAENKDQIAQPESLKRTDRLIRKAKEVALSAVEPENTEARKKIETALERRLRPYIEENEIIADQITSPEYKNFTIDVANFLGTRPGGVQCSDGRVLNIAIFDPLVGVLHKRPQGLPETRTSTFDGSPVLEDQTIASSITTTIKKRRRQGKNPEITEFIGPHIDSMHTLHGCGAAKAKIEAGGQAQELAEKEGMKLGGVDIYFDELGKGFNAFNTDIKRAGGEGNTFDMTHDAYSQGLIFGLRDAYLDGRVDRTKSFRDNLEALHKNGEILMTELLDRELQDDLLFAKANLNIPQNEILDIKNPHHFASNMEKIGRLAMEVTKRHENSEEKFAFIPESLKANKTDNAVRTLAYTAIRNCVYRNLVGIEPGKHDLLDHPEQMVRFGPIGASFNQKNISFGHVTPSGLLRPQDEAGVDKLYSLANIYMPQLKDDLAADFTKEGRIILATEEYDESRYADPDAAEDAFERKTSNVRRNVATIKKKYAKGVANGDTIVLGAIYRSKSRRMTDIISSFAKDDNLYS